MKDFESKSAPHWLDAFLGAIGDVRYSLDANVLKARSLDYFWYSPILKEQLSEKRADVIVMPTSQAELRLVICAAVKQGVAVTLRGGGTGNYGQCVPLEGGVVADVTGLNQIIEIAPGRVKCEAGVRISKLDDACAQTGQQILMYPSTRKMATIGGFLAGGSGGIGSLRHGMLRDDGNVISLKVMTIEEDPKIIELAGSDIQKVQHAYGTNGVIIELELALTEYKEWDHTAVLFDGYDDALRFCLMMSQADVDCYLLTAVERRFAQFYSKFGDLFPSDRDAVFAMVAPEDREKFAHHVNQMGGKVSFVRTLDELHSQGLPPAYECGWNHTTLMALKVDPTWTYLQVAYPQPIDPELVTQQMHRYGDVIFWHHEVARMHGDIQVFAIPIVRYENAKALYQIIAELEEDGCTIYDPHVVTIEDGGMKEIDTAQIEFKKSADPFGLLNPGKTRGWTADMAIQLQSEDE